MKLEQIFGVESIVGAYTMIKEAFEAIYYSGPTPEEDKEKWYDGDIVDYGVLGDF